MVTLITYTKRSFNVYTRESLDKKDKNMWLNIYNHTLIVGYHLFIYLFIQLMLVSSCRNPVC